MQRTLAQHIATLTRRFKGPQGNSKAVGGRIFGCGGTSRGLVDDVQRLSEGRSLSCGQKHTRSLVSAVSSARSHGGAGGRASDWSKPWDSGYGWLSSQLPKKKSNVVLACVAKQTHKGQETGQRAGRVAAGGRRETRSTARGASAPALVWVLPQHKQPRQVLGVWLALRRGRHCRWTTDSSEETSRFISGFGSQR